MNRKNRKEKKKRINAVSSSKSSEVGYRKALESLSKSLARYVEDNIVPLIKSFQAEYVNDAYARTLEEAFERMRRSYENINVQAQIVANSFVNNSDRANKQRFYSAIEQGIGIDLSSIVQSENLEDILVATTRQNVSLIKSIPEEYFKKIESIVFTGTTQGRVASSIIEEIRKTNNGNLKRAKVIARDQSSKLNSALNQQRQQNLGVEEYIWRTAGDERVRDSHKSKNGKIYRWDDPPADTGHPGQDIQCRCVAQPIIKL